MFNTNGTAQTARQNTAGIDLVQSYLDNLLREVGADIARGELFVETEPEAALAEFPVAPQPVLQASLVENIPETVAVPDSDLTPVLPLELDPKSVRVVPDWARQGFAGLVFEVAGLKMAAPLHALGGISLIEDRLQPVVGQADWFMGLLRWNGRNLRVVDTARFVMPERLDTNDHHAAYQSVIVLGDSHWALAVDCADKSVNLAADEIRWKQLTGTRPWLAGTLLQRLCALLDVDNLMTLLQQHEQQIRNGLSSDQQG